MTFLLLFWEFFKIGLFAVGGGLATVPFLYDLATKYTWFDSAFVADMIAISEATPGPIGINMSTYAGFRAGFLELGMAGGILGGLTATLAICLPAFFIVLTVGRVLGKFKENALVQGAFTGLRPAVTGLIMAAAFEVLRISLISLPGAWVDFSLLTFFNFQALFIFGFLYILLKKLKWHPIAFIAVGALAGIVFGF